MRHGGSRRPRRRYGLWRGDSRRHAGVRDASAATSQSVPSHSRANPSATLADSDSGAASSRVTAWSDMPTLPSKRSAFALRPSPRGRNRPRTPTVVRTRLTDSRRVCISPDRIGATARPLPADPVRHDSRRRDELATPRYFALPLHTALLLLVALFIVRHAAGAACRIARSPGVPIECVLERCGVVAEIARWQRSVGGGPAQAGDDFAYQLFTPG